MLDVYGQKIFPGSIITNGSSEYQIAVVTKIASENRLEVLQFDNSDEYFFPNNSWGTHVKVVSQLVDELDMHKIRASGSEIRRNYIDNRRRELREEMDKLDEMARDIFYDG